MRLRFKHESDDKNTIHFNATIKKFCSDENREFSYPFAVHHKEAKQFIFEFQRNPSQIIIEDKSYNIILEGKLMGSENWIYLNEYIIHIPESKLKSVSERLTVIENLK